MMDSTIVIAMQIAMTQSINNMFSGVLKMLFIAVVLPVLGNAVFHVWTNRRSVAKSSVSVKEFNESIRRAHAKREEGDNTLHKRIDESDDDLKKVGEDVAYIRGRIDSAIKNGNKNA